MNRLHHACAPKYASSSSCGLHMYRHGWKISSGLASYKSQPALRCIPWWPLCQHLALRAVASSQTGSSGFSVPSGNSSIKSDERSQETRCEHCFITFATAQELAHHAQHHCFPHSPETVLHLFPRGSKVIDNVKGTIGEVIGPASNIRRIHSAVSVQYLSSGVICDVQISRLSLSCPLEQQP
eukprot:gnl/MRDRNA2_/MRDRNA2_80596_c0_seq1.p1 gnl/MRDRNA2_/MRDRNA2_80596_c0~~gnl/MRDRNA2_/MRDRNA2_80596_c0_seq1.p1  ORF type:complete len:182 (-),score=11.35 gnl/MRDRNA2_/MRDRNA2_80596_c0_seq1:272-817(-)